MDDPAAVLIYREDAEVIDTRSQLGRLCQAAQSLENCSTPDAVLSLLIDIAEFEAAVVDALARDSDNCHPAAALLREASIAAAGAWIQTRSARQPSVTLVRQALDRVWAQNLPSRILLRVSEGYAYYALFPDTYVIAAQRFVAELSPRRCVVIGIRSIGTSLSAVVAATVSASGVDVWSCCVRPRGHPFSRRVRADGRLEQCWREWASRGAIFVVVDEGPGLSGSSFASVVRAVEEADIGADRIVLFPSWSPNPEQLLSSEAREIWTTHRRYFVDAAAAGITPESLFGVKGETRNYSAGWWRTHLCGARWPAVNPRDERWKTYVAGAERLIKFVGLGRYGELSAARAQQLFDLGEGPEPGELRRGFLDMPFVPGVPVQRASADDARVIGRYIGRLAGTFATNTPAPLDSLAHMVETNVSELLGAPVRLPSPVVGPSIDIDARMLQHEWIRTTRGLVKVDNLDHHRDHFFPGSNDPAWDLAGAVVELQAPRDALIREYERISGDKDVRNRLPFHLVAYTAFRAGYATVAAQTLRGTPDGHRFARLRQRYIRALCTYVRGTRLTPSAP